MEIAKHMKVYYKEALKEEPMSHDIGVVASRVEDYAFDMIRNSYLRSLADHLVKVLQSESEGSEKPESDNFVAQADMAIENYSKWYMSGRESIYEGKSVLPEYKATQEELDLDDQLFEEGRGLPASAQTPGEINLNDNFADSVSLTAYISGRKDQVKFVLDEDAFEDMTLDLDPIEVDPTDSRIRVSMQVRDLTPVKKATSPDADFVRIDFLIMS